jgi:hypothetical protein
LELEFVEVIAPVAAGSLAQMPEADEEPFT